MAETTSQNLVVNGGFELPIVPSGQYNIIPSGAADLGWTVEWMPLVTATSQGYNRPIHGEVDILNGLDGLAAGEGSQFAELDSTWSTAGYVPGIPASVKIYQDIPTTPGQTYTVKYMFSPRPGYDATQNRLEFSWNGHVISENAENGVGLVQSAWKTYQYDLVATAATTRIQFADLGTPDQFGTMLDNVSVTSKTYRSTLSNGQNAIDALGQYNDSLTDPAPVYSKGVANNIVNILGLSAPSGVAIDTIHHRLFEAERNNNRVLVYNLDSNNNLIDRIPDNVLGQPDFHTNTAAVTQSGMNVPRDVMYDGVHNRLFVSEINNNRVLVFDVSSITNGQNAVNVLGQPDFTTNTAGATQSKMSQPRSTLYDSATNRLFVADSANNRVLIFDISSITNGQNAVNVLGQSNFTSNGAAVSQSGMSTPQYVAYDSATSRLFVSEFGNNRVSVFSVSAITNGQNAVNVLGQSNFTSNGAAVSQSGMNGPVGFVFISSSNRLFISDNANHRVLIFDVSAITDGQNAVNVLGQSNFTSGGAATAQNRMNFPAGLAYDDTNNRLIVSDAANNRVTFFNVSTITDGQNAIDEVGQYDDNLINPGPVYNRGAANSVPNALGLSISAATGNIAGSVIDSTNHRLFVTDSGNNRVLEYNLDASNNLLDRVPDKVLGQPDFHSNASVTTQSGMRTPGGLDYDSVTNRLFVVDRSSNRVLVFDVSTITNGQNAVNVLGQPNFTSGGAATTQTGMRTPGSVAYDPVSKRLFVDDQGNHRVIVFDVTSITNGQPAINVLGQATFTTATAAITQSGMNTPIGIALDVPHNRLFVAEAGANRVTVYDVATITNGEPAVNVLGQSNFTSAGPANNQSGMNNVRQPAYDSVNNRLFVPNVSNNRVLVFDVSTITNGQNAINVLGQPNFTSAAAATTQTGMNGPVGATYDNSTNRLYVRDGNNRVLIFDVFVDSIPPAVAITSPADGTLTNQSSIVVTGTAQDNVLVDSVSCNNVPATLDGSSVNKTFSATVPFVLEGSITISCVARDGADNISSTATITINRDATAPEASGTVFTPSIPSSNVTVATNLTDVTGVVSASAVLKDSQDQEVGTSPLAQSTGTAQSGSWGGAVGFSNSIPDGTYTIEISATDTAGNTAAYSAGTILLDRSAPHLSIVSIVPAYAKVGENVVVTASAKDDTSGLSSVTVTDQAVSVTTPMALTDGSSDAGQVGTYQGSFLSGSPDGDHSLVVTASDNATPANSFTQSGVYSFDQTAPVISDDSLPAITNNSHMAVSGTVTDNIGVGSFTVNNEVVVLGAGGAFSQNVLLVEGLNTIVEEAIDLAGNPVSSTRTIILDTTSPTIADDGSPAATNQSSIIVSGTVSDANTVASFTVNGQPVSLGAGGAYSTTVSLSEGSNTILEIATDSAGNSASSTRTISRDTGSPTITNDLIPLSTNNASFNVSGKVTDPAPSSGIASLTVNGNVVTTASDGSFSQVITLVEGNNTITEDALDAAGNSAHVVQTILLDTKAPVTTKTTHDIDGDGLIDSLTLSAEDSPLAPAIASSGVASISYSINGGSAVTVTGSTANITLPPVTSSVSISFWATDKAGNSETPTVQSFAVDLCPTVSGSYQGCKFGDKTNVVLHIVDQQKSGVCGYDKKGKANSECKNPIAGSVIKVFDRENAAFLASFGSKRPNKKNLDLIYESNAGKVGECTTDVNGICIAGEDHAGKFLVIAKFVDGGKTIYNGKFKNFKLKGRKTDGNEKEDDDDDIDDVKASPTLIEKNIRILKTIKKDGTVTYEAGSMTVVTGSELDVVYPEYAVWEGTAMLYPFIMSSDSVDPWTVDVCMQVPVGYKIEGVLDESGKVIGTSSCTQSSIAGQPIVVLFSLVDVGSPEPTFGLTLNATHKGKKTQRSFNVDGIRRKTKDVQDRDLRSKIKAVKDR